MLHLHQKSTYTTHIYIYICICNTHTHPFLHAKYAPIIHQQPGLQLHFLLCHGSPGSHDYRAGGARLAHGSTSVQLARWVNMALLQIIQGLATKDFGHKTRIAYESSSFWGTQNTDNRRQSVSFCYSLQYTLPWRVEGHSPALQLASVASVLLPEKTGWKQMHTYYVVSRYVHILYIIHLSY